MSTDAVIEKEIQEKGLTAPRITPADVEAEIRSAHYFIASDAIQHDNAFHEFPQDAGWLLGRTQVLTICVLQMTNGFVISGESAPVDSANFDAEVGRKAARANAIEKVWPLLGFRLRDKLSNDELCKPGIP